MMPIKTYGSTSYEVNEKGYLRDINSWDENFARGIAEEEGFQLDNDLQWVAIKIIQEYYKKNRLCPMMRILVQRLRNVKGEVRGDGSMRQLVELFHGDPKIICKIAGLPNAIGF